VPLSRKDLVKPKQKENEIIPIFASETCRLIGADSKSQTHERLRWLEAAHRKRCFTINAKNSNT
jgi:plasmid maintenance system killer protein